MQPKDRQPLKQGIIVFDGPSKGRISTGPVKLEALAVKAFRFMPWSLSALLSVRLFLQMATEPFSKVLLAALALTLEGGKLLALVQYRRSRKIDIALLTLVLILLSITASAGSALQLIDERQRANDRAQVQLEIGRADRARLEQGVALLDRQISAVLGKLEETPVGWVGTVRSLRQELEVLRADRNHPAAVLGDISGETTMVEAAQADLFDLLSQAMGIPYESLAFGFLLIVAAALEALIALDDSSGPDRKHASDKAKEQSAELSKIQTVPRYSNEPSCQVTIGQTGRRPGRPRTKLDTERLLPVFTRILLDGVEPGSATLVSRDTAARTMGLSSWQAKTLYRMAVDEGYIETCGRRTKACRISA